MVTRPALTGGRAVLETGVAIQRLRELPCPGEVLVAPGDQLEPDDLVARCVSEERVLALDLAGALQVPAEDVPRYLLVHPGQQIEPGTVLAARPRPLRPMLRVKADERGVVIGEQEGSLFLRAAVDYQQLRAYLPGEVTEVYPKRGVLMQGAGHVLHGIWGAGREAAGLLSLEVVDPAAPLAWQRVTEHHYGMVLAAGVLQSAVALSRAAQYGVAGIIAGSLHPDLRQACRDAPFPVVITEGMGRIPMTAPAFALLQQHHGSRVVLAGDRRLTASGPELIIPGPIGSQGASLAAALTPGVGSLVRLTGFAHMGAVGEIVSLPREPQFSPAGESIRGAWVRLADRRMVFVALENLELLGSAPPDPLALIR